MTDVPEIPFIPTAPGAAPEPKLPTLVEASDAWVHQTEAPATDPEAAVSEQPRNPDGTFAAPTPTDAPAPEGTAPAPATPDPNPPADDPDLFIEAKQGEEIVKLRKDTLIPTKRHGETIWKPLSQVQSEGMLKQDYDLKMQERKAAERELHANRVRLEARERAFEEERTRMQAALADPAKFEEYQQHLQLLETSPAYKTMFERAQRATELEADQAAQEAVETQIRTEEAVEVANTWIAEACAKYPGVDEQRVRTRFGTGVMERTMTFHPSVIEAIAADEAQSITAALTPVQRELAEAKANAARLEAELAAARKNAATTHALNRAGTIPTGPIGGAAPAPGRRVIETPGGRRDFQTLSDSWKRGG